MPLHISYVCALLAGMVVACAGCDRESAEPPAVDDKPAAPENLLRLSPEQQENIGLQTAQVTRQNISKTISTTGWLLAKPGSEVVVKASATGFVSPVSDNLPVEVGSVVSDQQRIASLQVFLSPQEEAQLVSLKEDADTLIEQSLASLAIAKDRYDNVKKLGGTALAGKDVRALEEVVQRSQAAVREARDKLPYLPSEPYSRPLRLRDVAIESPLAGRVTQVHVRPRQLVVQGDPLWTLADWSSLWLKAPVFEGDLANVHPTAPAEIRPPGSKQSLQARRVEAPQPTEPGRRTVDVLYLVDNRDLALRPGQPVSVEIPTGAAEERLMAPVAAILWDGWGGAWVYVQADKGGGFRRQRVEVGQVHGDKIVIERGLDLAARVVVVGAESLYGEEFKSQLPVEDDD